MKRYITATFFAAACEQRAPVAVEPSVEDSSCVSDFETSLMVSADWIFSGMVMPGADCLSIGRDYYLDRTYWTDWWDDPLVCGDVSCVDMPLADGYHVITDDGAKFWFGENCGAVTDPLFLDDSGQLRLEITLVDPEPCGDL